VSNRRFGGSHSSLEALLMGIARWRTLSLAMALALYAGCGSPVSEPSKSETEACPDCCAPKSRSHYLKNSQESSIAANSESSIPVPTKE
jgi:hypothetical protein